MVEHAGDQQDDDRGRAQHLDRLEERDHPSAIGAIGEAPPTRVRSNTGAFMANDRARQERRRAERQEEPRLRDLLGPGADAREQAREPEGAEAPRPEQAERVAEGPNAGRDVRLPCRRSVDFALTVQSGPILRGVAAESAASEPRERATRTERDLPKRFVTGGESRE